MSCMKNTSVSNKYIKHYLQFFIDVRIYANIFWDLHERSVKENINLLRGTEFHINDALYSLASSSASHNISLCAKIILLLCGMTGWTIPSQWWCEYIKEPWVSSMIFSLFLLLSIEVNTSPTTIKLK